MWKEQASPSVSCSPPGETVGRRDRPRIGAVCPLVRLVSGGGDHITGDRLRPAPVWETACGFIPPAPMGLFRVWVYFWRSYDTLARRVPGALSPCPDRPGALGAPAVFRTPTL